MAVACTRRTNNAGKRHHLAALSGNSAAIEGKNRRSMIRSTSQKGANYPDPLGFKLGITPVEGFAGSFFLASDPGDAVAPDPASAFDPGSLFDADMGVSVGRPVRLGERSPACTRSASSVFAVVGSTPPAPLSVKYHVIPAVAPQSTTTAITCSTVRPFPPASVPHPSIFALSIRSRQRPFIERHLSPIRSPIDGPEAFAYRPSDHRNRIPSNIRSIPRPIALIRSSKKPKWFSVLSLYRALDFTTPL